MSSLPAKLVVYEINTPVWLNTLSKQFGKRITLDTVPDAVLDQLADVGLDMVWLMGVWQRSTFGRENALNYTHEYVHALPDLKDEDVIGSAYAIADYQVDASLGGRAALAALRERLRQRGLRLMLDYVPNHVAADHPWVDHADFVIRGTLDDVKKRPSDFFQRIDAHGNEFVVAHGRDPLFPGWADTAQLNAFNPALRRAAVDTLLDIASQCDGVRCDMAMLLMNDIFATTWRQSVGPQPDLDYWPEIIPQIKAAHPEFIFVAEVYWDKEYEIIQQGFDYAYDKTFYDRVIENDVQKLRRHLLASQHFQNRLMRFIENHDEPRAYDRLGPRRSFPAATLVCTLPGALLLHDGQFTGAIIKLPVQIRRQPDYEADTALEAYYKRLLTETRDAVYHGGDFVLFEIAPAGEHDITHFNMLAYGWHGSDHDYRLIVVNLTEYRSQGRVKLRTWEALRGQSWRLFDVTDGAEYMRSGGELTSEGLFIDLDAYESHIFRFQAVTEPAAEATTQA